MPGLPQEVIEELAAARARPNASCASSGSRRRATKPPTIRVKVASQPTFTRYVFDLPDATNVVPERSDGKLTLNFDQPIKWDLADAMAALPPTLKSIDTDVDYDSAAVIFVLNGTPQVRTFREDRSIVVDIGHDGAKPKQRRRSAADERRHAGRRAGGAVPAIAPPRDRAGRCEDAAAAAAPPPATAGARRRRRATGRQRPQPHESPPARRRRSRRPRLRRRSRRHQLRRRRRTPPNDAAAADAADAADERRQPAAAPIRTRRSWPSCTSIAATICALEFPFARADAGRRVPPRRHAVAGVRQRRQDRSRRASPATPATPSAAPRSSAARTARRSCASSWSGRGWSASTRTARPGSSPSATPSRCRRSPLADRAQHRRQEPRQHRHSVRRPAQGPSSRRPRRRRPAAGGHRARAGARFLKAQNFVELRALPSTQGVVVQPLADDVTAELSVDKITVTPAGRPVAVADGDRPAAAARRPISARLTFDTQLWGFDREAKFSARQAELIRLAAMAPPTKRRQARLNLARFYLARDMSAEAKARARRRAGRRARRPTTSPAPCSRRSPTSCSTGPRRRSRICPIRRSATSSMRRSGARSPMPAQGKWAEAHAGFKNVDSAIARAADRIAAHGDARGAARGDRGARFHRRRTAWSTNSRPSACRPRWSRRSPCWPAA